MEVPKRHLRVKGKNGKNVNIVLMSKNFKNKVSIKNKWKSNINKKSHYISKQIEDR